MFNNPIFSVARFEVKTLLRSWFFRIFTVLVIVWLVFMNLMTSTELGRVGWGGRMLVGGLPYLNLWLLNVAQSIIAIFLSSDFLNRDKKLDTTEVIYVRNMSNFQYVFGKTFGILYVFGLLNLTVLIFTFIINMISPDAGFSALTYVVYPLIISLSTLVFILGLSFFTMQLVRNQAVTFILLLGYIATVLFYLQNKHYGVWDYLGFFTPMAYSSYVGFTNINQLFFVRGGYFVLGLAFMLLTVLKLPRLSQSNKGIKLLFVGSILCMFTFVSMFSYYLIDKISIDNNISQFKEIEKKLPINAGYHIRHYDINIRHSQNSITGLIKSDIVFENKDEIPKKLKFYLNNGLKVTVVSINGANVSYNQNLNLLEVDCKAISSDKLVLDIEYQGTPNDNFSYFDLSKDERGQINRFDPLIADNKSVIVKSDYLLLTKEALWYPIVAERNAFRLQQFFTFDVNVESTKGLTIVSQGESSTNETGGMTFISSHPYAKISLVAGPFLQKSLQVDSVEYSIFLKKENNHFENYFNNLNDTLPLLIKELKTDYERKLGLTYPYKRLSIVEVPVNFRSLFRSWALTNENSQPEMIFIPESGVGIEDLNLASSFSREERNAKRNNEEVLPKEIEAKVFLRVIGNTFAQPVSGRGFFRGNNVGRTLDNWSPYSLFPLFYNYSYSVKEEGLPFYNMCLEAFMLSRIHDTNPRFGRMSSNDKSILFLRDNSHNLVKLTDQEDLPLSIADIIVTVGNNLFATAQARIGYDEFNSFVDSVLDANPHKNIDGSIFEDIVKGVANKLTDESEENGYLKLPSFIFGKNEAYEFKDGNRKRFFIGLEIANDGDVDGIVKVSVYGGGRGGSGGGRGQRGGGPPPGGGGPGGPGGPGGERGRPQMTATYESIYLIEKDKQKKIGIILDKPPRMMNVHTYLSKNVPSDIRLPLADFSEAPSGLDAFLGIKEFDGKIKTIEDNEIVVDNESEGFSVVNTSGRKTLKEIILSGKDEENEDNSLEYKNMSFFRPAARWTPVLNSFAFGKHIKSFSYKKSGDGNGKAIFKAQLPVSGRYNVYAMIPSKRLGNFRNQDPKDAYYSFTVHHDDGEEIKEVPIDNDSSEWSFLGEYYFSEGEVLVELSDKSAKNIIIADAVKWVKL